MKDKKRERELKVDEFLDKKDDGFYINYDNLYTLVEKFRKDNGFAIRRLIHLMDINKMDEYDKEATKQLMKDIEEQILEETEEPLKCEKCGNDEDFSVFISTYYMKLKKGKIMDEFYLHNEGRICKPDDITFACSKCNFIVLESLLI